MYNTMFGLRQSLPLIIIAKSFLWNAVVIIFIDQLVQYMWYSKNVFFFHCGAKSETAHPHFKLNISDVLSVSVSALFVFLWLENATWKHLRFY